MGFIRDGEFLVTLDDKGRVQRWNHSLEMVADFMLPFGFTYVVGNLDIEQDFIVCDSNAGRTVMSLLDGKVLARLEASASQLGAVALSRDGRLLATGNWRGEVELYDPATWHRLGPPLRCHTGRIWDLALSPDSRRLVTGVAGREGPRLWDVESRQQVCILPADRAGGLFLEFAANGRSLVSADPSGRLHIVTAQPPKS